MSKSFLRDANIPKTDVVSQCGAIVVAKKERFAPRDGYWNGFSNVARGTRESLPLQRSKYILLRYALMHYSDPHRERPLPRYHILSRALARVGRSVANCNALASRIISRIFPTFVKYNDEALSRMPS